MVALDKDRLARLADNSEIARRWPSLSEELKRKNAIADNFASWLSKRQRMGQMTAMTTPSQNP